MCELAPTSIVVLEDGLELDPVRRLNRVVQLDRFFRTKGGAPYESSCEAELIADFAVYDAKCQAILFPMRDDAVIAQSPRDLLIFSV